MIKTPWYRKPVLWIFGARRTPFGCPRLLPLFVLIVAAVSPIFAQTVQVPGNSNIYAAGHPTPTAPGGGGAGVLPQEYDFGFTATSNLFVTFSSITGTVIVNTGSGDNANDPDGVGAGSTSSSVNSLNGLSGITGPNAGFLVGVFENDIEPMDPAPAALNFSSIGTNFTSLSPLLNQVFFIGDGLTGDKSGSVQQFIIPNGATRLFLGIADAPGYHGDPGGYDDNTGQFTASFTIGPEPIPEPSVLVLIAVAAVFAFVFVRPHPSKT
jgi:hypothetical protein